MIFLKKIFTKWCYKKGYKVRYSQKKLYLMCPWYIKPFSFLFSRSVFEEENKKYNKYGYCNYEK